MHLNGRDRVSSAALRRLLHLCAELQDSPENPRVQAQRFLSCICELLRARSGAIFAQKDVRPQPPASRLSWIIRERIDSTGLRLGRSLQDESSKSLAAIRRWQSGFPCSTCPRRAAKKECLGDHCEVYRRYLRLTVEGENTFFATANSTAGVLVACGIHEPMDRDRFTRHDCALVELVNREFGWFLHRLDVAMTPCDPVHELPPRHQRVFEGLVRGLSEKQVSLQTGLRPSTVHEYAKALHKKLGVSSRGELLAAYFNRNRPFVTKGNGSGGAS